MDKPVAGLLQGPEAARPARRDARRLGRRVRPHADDREGRRPRPQPLRLHDVDGRRRRERRPDASARPTNSACTPSRTGCTSTTCTPRSSMLLGRRPHQAHLPPQGRPERPTLNEGEPLPEACVVTRKLALIIRSVPVGCRSAHQRLHSFWRLGRVVTGRAQWPTSLILIARRWVVEEVTHWPPEYESLDYAGDRRSKRSCTPSRRRRQPGVCSGSYGLLPLDHCHARRFAASQAVTDSPPASSAADRLLVRVELANRGYEIEIGSGNFDAAGHLSRAAAFDNPCGGCHRLARWAAVAEARRAHPWLRSKLPPTCWCPPGEQSKSDRSLRGCGSRGCSSWRRSQDGRRGASAAACRRSGRLRRRHVTPAGCRSCKSPPRCWPRSIARSAARSASICRARRTWSARSGSRSAC